MIKRLRLVVFAMCVAAAPASKPTTKPAREFFSPLEVLETVAPLPKAPGDWTQVKIDAFNDTLNQLVKDHKGTFLVKVQDVRRDDELKQWLVIGEEAKVGYLRVWLWPRLLGEKKKVTALKVGDVVRVSGIIYQPAFLKRGDAIALELDMKDCVLK